MLTLQTITESDFFLKLYAMYSVIDYRITQKLGLTNKGGMTNRLVGLLVAAVVMVALMPTIITQLTDMNTTGWGATEVALVAIFPIIAVIAIFYLFLKEGGILE